MGALGTAIRHAGTLEAKAAEKGAEKEKARANQKPRQASDYRLKAMTFRKPKVPGVAPEVHAICKLILKIFLSLLHLSLIVLRAVLLFSPCKMIP